MNIKATYKTFLSKFFGNYSLDQGGGRSKVKNDGIDWILFLATLPLLGAGLLTMNSFTGDSYYFNRQVIWIGIAIIIFFALSFVDFRFLRKRSVSVIIFIITTISLAALLVIGRVSHGASGWINLGAFALQPADLAKLTLIIILAKYFSRRHIEIANVKHIIVSGLYAFCIFALILVEPDFGSAIIIFFIWLGMVLVSGISKKHLLVMFLLGAIAFGSLWLFGFKDYQKNRIKSFIHPLSDIHNTGYNAYQSTIAVGSGGVLGKGVGYGTQSRLKFLPEYQTDFIFAAFAEEWGLVGVVIVFLLYMVIIWRIIAISMHGESNLEMLFGAGIAILFIIQFGVNVGMNMQLLPVTGQTLPFVSYGGTHLITEFGGLGILMGMRRYRRVTHQDSIKSHDFLE